MYPEKNTIASEKVDEKFSLETGKMERGVKGMLPLDCLPHWGREGVTLIPSSKCKKIWAATGFLQSKKKFFLSPFFSGLAPSFLQPVTL